MNKRIKALITVTLIMGLAVGCSNSQQNKASQNTKSSTTVTSTEKSQTGEVKITDTEVKIGDTTYIYGKKDSSMGDAKQIDGTDIYYSLSKDSKAIEGNLYGTTHMTYAQYYENEITQKDNMDSDGMYDGITSATSAKGSHDWDYPEILAYTPGEEKDGEVTKPFTIDGIDTVDVAVSADTYVQGLILNKIKHGESMLGDMVEKLKLNDDFMKPAFNNNVKTLLADGSFTKGEMVEADVSPVSLETVSASTSVLYSSRYGDYELKIDFDGFDSEENSKLNYSKYLMNLYSATITDENGVTAGAKHYEDIWDEQSRKYWMSIALTNGDFEVSGYKFKSDRFSDFFQDKILKPGKYTLNIKSRGYEDITSEFVVGITLNDDQKITVEDSNWNYSGENSVKVDTAALPADYKIENVVLKTKYGKKDLVRDTDFSYDQSSNMLMIKGTELTGPHNYTVELHGMGYEPAITSFKLKSDLTQEQISMKDGQLSIDNNASTSLEDYTKKIYKILVQPENGEKQQHWQGWGTTIINADGTINLEAAGRDKSPIFKSGETYTLSVTAHGYETFKFAYTTK